MKTNLHILSALLLLLIGFSAKAQELESFEDKNGKWGFRDNNKKIIISAKYDEINSNYFLDGRVAVKLNEKWGVIDSLGNEITIFKYNDITCFNDGIAGVKLNDKWGAINKSGKEIVPIIYEDIINSLSSCAYVYGGLKLKQKNKWGVIDTNNKVIIPFVYDSLHYFHEPPICLGFKNDKISIIDLTTKKIIETSYNSTGGFIGGNLLAVEQNKKWGLINTKGVEIISLKYDYLVNGEEFFLTKKNDKWGCIDIKGNEIVPIKYTGLRGNSEEKVFSVNINGDWFINEYSNLVHNDEFEGTNSRWGLIDYEGKEITEMKYEKMSIFYKGKAEVTLNGRTFYIDKNGNEVKE
jgi:hypothetical protein